MMRDQILKRPRGERTPYHLPEWGEGAFCKRLSGLERADFEHRCEQYKDKTEEEKAAWHFAELLVATTVDGEGKPVFTPEDVADLAAEDAGVLLRAGAIASAWNKLRREDLEEARKNC